MRAIEETAITFGVKFVRHGSKALYLLFAVGFLMSIISATVGYRVGLHQADLTEQETGAMLCCALCGQGSYHAPVLVNLSTGDIGEMVVYDSAQPRNGATIATRQRTGTFSFIDCAGVIGRRNTCDHTCEANIPRERAPMQTDRFCHHCRQLLENTSSEGYVLADLYDLNSIQVYAVTENAEHQIREYSVDIIPHSTRGETTIIVTGHVDGIAFVE